MAIPAVRWRNDHLGAEARAGRWARSQAQRRRYEFVRRLWPRLLLLFSLFASLSVPAWLLPSPLKGVVIGALVASGGWAVALVVATMSGAAPVAMGDVAEQWTALELRALRSRGWHIAHGLRLRHSDIDHIAVGGGGLVVVETKWSGDGWSSRFAADRAERAVKGVHRHARDLQLMFPHVRPVVPAVVLWGRPEPADPIRIVDGVAIMAGDRFAEWAVTQCGNHVPQDDIEQVWKVLSDHAARRDRHDEATETSSPSIDRTITGVAIGGYLGFVSASGAYALLGGWFVPLGVSMTVLTWRLRRHPQHGLRAAAAAFAAAFVTLLVAGATGISML